MTSARVVPVRTSFAAVPVIVQSFAAPATLPSAPWASAGPTISATVAVERAMLRNLKRCLRSSGALERQSMPSGTRRQALRPWRAEATLLLAPAEGISGWSMARASTWGTSPKLARGLGSPRYAFGDLIDATARRPRPGGTPPPEEARLSPVDLADARDADEGGLLRPGLDLRAEARRPALAAVS